MTKYKKKKPAKDRRILHQRKKNHGVSPCDLSQNFMETHFDYIYSNTKLSGQKI
jgi:hypothetical protein